MRIDENSRVAILGRNGSGKSTLLNLIVGNTIPNKGETYRHHNLGIGYFNQHHVDNLNLEISSLEHMLNSFPGSKEQEMRGCLGRFGIHGNLALQKMGTLSGGQKSRVVFASITYLQPQLLVLDEPTNHLDFDTITSLTDTIKSFNGAVIIVSHDQALISSCANDLYVVAKGTVKKFDGGFMDYKQMVINGDL